VAIVAAASPPPASAQTSMETILTNGPISNRLNLVFLSEGYTSSQLGQFLVDATNAVNTLLSHLPWREYSSYVNAFAIKIASAQSGSDHPRHTITNSTYFNSFYDPDWDYYITIPPDSTGQGKVDALLQPFPPQSYLAILLVNDPKPGGSDAFGKTAIVSTSAVATEAVMGQPSILSHETAHVLANLGDEYTTPYPGFPDIEEPNTTRETNRTLIKWQAWIATNTPVPTPNNYGEDGVVGLFEGAHYHETGWYRPTYSSCVMNFLGQPFCPVCSEALVLAIYQKVRPIDSFSPASTYLLTTNTQPLSFSVNLLQPVSHSLSVQWLTNGAPYLGASNTNMTLPPQTLPFGSNWISALVTDNTPLVRTDPTALLGQTLTWSLNVNHSQLQLDSLTRLAGGRIAFRVTGNAPQGVVIQSSTNLLNWFRVATNALAAGQFWHTNSGASSNSRTFYRAVTPP